MDEYVPVRLQHGAGDSHCSMEEGIIQNIKPMTNTTQSAVVEMQKAINALRLELPAAIVNDIQKKFDAVKEATAASLHSPQGAEVQKLQQQLDQYKQAINNWEEESREIMVKNLSDTTMRVIEEMEWFLPENPAYKADYEKAKLEYVSRFGGAEKEGEESKVIYRDGDIKITESDAAQWHYEDAQYLRGVVAEKNERIAALTTENEELESWKRQAMEVMPDYQKIGKLLNIPLGQSVHDKIVPGIQALTTELAQLKEQRRKEVEREKILREIFQALTDGDTSHIQIKRNSPMQKRMWEALNLSKFQGAEGQQNDNV